MHLSVHVYYTLSFVPDCSKTVTVKVLVNLVQKHGSKPNNLKLAIPGPTDEQ